MIKLIENTLKCKATDCENKARARGWCWNHYYIAKNHGDNFAKNHKIKPRGSYKGFYTCKIEGCEEKHFAKGYCDRHYAGIRTNKKSKKQYKPRKKRNNNRSKNIYYRLWTSMMDRCYNKNFHTYENYGGRGIDVYKEWHDGENFTAQIVSLIGERPSNRHSLDRIDNDRGYYPDNVRWATQKEQMNNTRYSNVLTAKRLAEITGYSRERIRQLTYQTSSDPNCKNCPLKPHVEKEISTKKNTHYIYKTSAIGYLMNRKLGEFTRRSFIFMPFNYYAFLRANPVSLEELSSILDITVTSLRQHINRDKIRKEHYRILEEKGFNVKEYAKLNNN